MSYLSHILSQINFIATFVAILIGAFMIVTYVQAKVSDSVEHKIIPSTVMFEKWMVAGFIISLALCIFVPTNLESSWYEKTVQEYKQENTDLRAKLDIVELYIVKRDLRDDFESYIKEQIKECKDCTD